MKAQELREKFVQFFKEYDHKKLSSSSLIPHNDPTLLFTNAGMNQFKDYFTGKETPSHPRAVTIQKCVRAGGKHNDLENVGFTARHHTFFEMLGNFSFGDYFKSEAIGFAWKFLTEELKIPKDRLYVTVHTSDDEAEELWIKEQGVPKERIFRMGDKDNFWEMGDTGPCGPCSEIFYDHGKKYATGTFENPLEDESRVVEIWNLVFMQYEKQKDGSLKKLPKPSVDTGAGLERLAAVMQGVYWNYDTDLFTPIFKELERLSGKKYSDPKSAAHMRVIADHIRSATMLITDGALPSNEGRGYVLRRIIRRAVRHANDLGLTDISLYKLVSCVFDILGKEYQDNKQGSALAQKTLKLEEEKFRSTLNNGLKILEQAISESKSKVLSGDIAFKLYDTYGFPLDLTETILQEREMSVNKDEFQEKMDAQVALSKKHQKFSADDDDIKKFFALKEKFGATEFLGYEKLSTDAKLLAIEKLREDQFALLFNKTPFYGESGGQMGDRGVIELTSGKVIEIHDVQKPVEDLYLHFVPEIDSLEINKTYPIKVDRKTRSETIKNHSATHLLQAALIEVLGPHIKQAGSLVTDEKLRFDFTHDKALTEREIIEVEKIVNNQIQEGSSVAATFMKKDEAIAKGAMALFGEKYGETVRVITMGDFSTELCGGTHVQDTKEIALFKIISESSLSTGIRRVEALTHEKARNFLTKRSSLLSNIEQELSVKSEKVIQKVQSLVKDIKKIQKENQQLKDQLRAKETEDIFKNPIDLGSSISFYDTKTDSEPKDLRKISDTFIDKFPNDILFLTSTSDDKVAFVIRTHRKNKSINLSGVTKNALSKVEGRGGGKPDMTQGSVEKKDFSDFRNILIEELKS